MKGIRSLGKADLPITVHIARYVNGISLFYLSHDFEHHNRISRLLDLSEHGEEGYIFE
ncbi:MAG: hypothetical protein HGB17_14250 [Syntrophobacteraceae bacterium]|nr:hypothetical protein [Syntrophobacteraceae bacterium]